MGVTLWNLKTSKRGVASWWNPTSIKTSPKLIKAPLGAKRKRPKKAAFEVDEVKSGMWSVQKKIEKQHK